LVPPKTDLLYDFINYLAHLVNGGIYLVNSIVATILVLGVYFFSKNKKYFPYLFIYSIPYLFFIVGMGYTRQALAIGFIFWSLAFFERNKKLFGWLALILAVLSHKSALIVLLLVSLLIFNPFLFVVNLTIVAVTYNLYSAHIINAIMGYVIGQMQSAGFLARFLVGFLFLIPFLWLTLWRKFKELNLQVYIPYIVLYLLIIFIYLKYNLSTIADRLFLYTYPLQLYAIDYILRNFRDNLIIKFVIFILSFLILVV